jgi:membrane associated rhomboid family serine protease
VRERLRHLPVTLAVCALVAALATAVGGLAGGGAGAVGALTGVALVVLSYVLSSLAIAWADSVNPQLVFPVGMVAYLTKFTFLGLVMVALLGSTWSGITAHAMGIVAGVVAWTGTQIWWVSTKGRPRIN